MLERCIELEWWAILVAPWLAEYARCSSTDTMISLDVCLAHVYSRKFRTPVFPIESHEICMKNPRSWFTRQKELKFLLTFPPEKLFSADAPSIVNRTSDKTTWSSIVSMTTKFERFWKSWPQRRESLPHPFGRWHEIGLEKLQWTTNCAKG